MKTKIVVAALMGIMAVILAIGVFTGFGNKTPADAQIPSSESVALAQTKETTVYQDEAANSEQNVSNITSTAEPSGVWQQIIPKGDSNLGYTGYLTLGIKNGGDYAYYKSYGKALDSMGLVAARSYVDEEVTTISTGHTVYVRPENGDNGGFDANDDTYGHSNRFIISGYDLLELDGYDSIAKNAGYLLHKERSGERIRLFDTKAELDAANVSWKSGQEILSGSQEERKCGIILDGRLLNDDIVWRKESDGKVTLPMALIAPQYSSGSYVTSNGLLHVPFAEGMGYPFIEIPSISVQDDSAEAQFYGIDKEAGTWVYNGNIIENNWSDTFPLSSDSFDLSLDDVVRLMGWKVSWDGIMVCIETDSGNVNNNFILRSDIQQSIKDWTESEIEAVYGVADDEETYSGQGPDADINTDNSTDGGNAEDNNN